MIIVPVENGEAKEIIMKRKERLGRKKMFIENDLTWEERKRQEKIFKWVKEEREKSRYVKMGRVKVEGKWVNWREIEQEIEEKMEKKKTEEEEKEKRGKKRNQKEKGEEEGSNRKIRREEGN